MKKQVPVVSTEAPSGNFSKTIFIYDKFHKFPFKWDPIQTVPYLTFVQICFKQTEVLLASIYILLRVS